jgi:aspartate aminotransferase/aminotransferase
MRMRFAERLIQVKTSGIRELFDRARHLPDPIDLSLGQADFDVPDEVKDATIAAIRQGCGGYGVTQGDPELVLRTRDFLRARFGLADDEEILMTSGVSGGITLALLALVDPGDEVLIPDPHFVIYRSLVHLAGGTPVLYDLDSDFRLREDELRCRVSPRTKALLLNSPANPTGVVLSAAEVGAAARIAEEHDLTVISDELYEPFVYEGAHATIKRFLGKRALLLGGFSKSHGMAGWRLGWAAGDPELIDRMRMLQQYVYVCPPTLVQRGAVAAFDVDLSGHVADYRRKRDLIHGGLVAAGYRCVKPHGSFFAFPAVPDDEDDVSFTERALAESLIVVPGRTFSSRTTHVRLSFAVSDATLERAVLAFRRLARAGS